MSRFLAVFLLLSVAVSAPEGGRCYWHPYRCR